MKKRSLGPIALTLAFLLSGCSLGDGSSFSSGLGSSAESSLSREETSSQSSPSQDSSSSSVHSDSSESATTSEPSSVSSSSAPGTSEPIASTSSEPSSSSETGTSSPQSSSSSIEETSSSESQPSTSEGTSSSSESQPSTSEGTSSSSESQPSTSESASGSESSSEHGGTSEGEAEGQNAAIQKAIEAFDLTMGAKGFLSAKSEAAAGPDGEVVTMEMRLDIEATYQRGSDVAFASSVIQTTSMGDQSMTSGLNEEGPYFRDERGLSYREGHKMDGTVERFYDVPFPSFDSAYMSPFSILTVRDLIFVEDGVFRLPKGIASAISYAFIDQVFGGPAIDQGPDEMLLYLDGERFSRVEYEIPYLETGLAYVASFDLSYEDEVEAISHLDDLSGLEPTEDSIRLEKAFEALSSPIAFDIEWGSGDVTSYYRGENAVYFDYHGEPRYYAPMKEGDELLYPYYGEPGFGEFDTNSPVSIDRLVPNGSGINTTLFSPVDGKASTYRIEGSDLAEAVFDLLVPADVLSFYLGGLEAVEAVLNDDGTLDMVDFLSSSSSHTLIRYRQYEGMPSGYDDSPILNIELLGLSNFLDSLVEGPDGIAYTVKSPFLEESLSLYLTERSLFLEGNGRKSWYTAVEGMDGIQELDLYSGTPVITGATFDSMDHLLPGFFVDKNPIDSFFPISKSAYESDSIDAMSFLFPAPQVLNDMGFNVYDVVSLKIEIDASNNSFIISGQDASGTTIVDVYGEEKPREDGLDDSVPYPLPDKEG